MREQAELDTLFTRVQSRDHYAVLGVTRDAPRDVIEREYRRLQRWLEALLDPDRPLGDQLVRVEVVGHAVESAWRVLGNPRERFLYDGRSGSRTPSGSSSLPPAPTLTPTPAPRRRTASQVPLDPEDRTRLLLDLLGLHLAVALDTNVTPRDLVGDPWPPQDVQAMVIKAEDAERNNRWTDAAMLWHLVAALEPRDPGHLLRAASAMRRVGAPAALVERYFRFARENPLFR
jgi:hypothetical protein